MKRKLISLLSALCLFVGLGATAACKKESDPPSQQGASSESSAVEVVKNLNYELSLDGSYYIVAGIGDVTDTDIVIPSTYENLPVKEVKARAFSNDYEKLTSVTFEEGVTKISNSAFEKCELLTKVALPASLQTIESNAFSGCYALTEVSLAESSRLTEIGYSAFSSCKGLTVFPFPSGLQTIDRYAFYGCERLAKALLPDSVTTLGEDAFSKCSALSEIAIPAQLTAIESGTFAFCHNLTRVTIPSQISRIGSGAFANCYKMVEVVNQSSLSVSVGSSDYGDIAKYATLVSGTPVWNFTNENGFIFAVAPSGTYLVNYVGESKTPVLPESFNGQAYELRKYAFYKNADVTGVTLPESLIRIGEYAFLGCTALTELHFNAVALEDLSECKEVFDNAGTAGNGFTLYVGARVTKIPAGLFYSYTAPKLTQIVFAENGVCESVGANAFNGCATLTDVHFPDSLSSIGENAFFGCGISSLGEKGAEGFAATLGSGMTTLGKNAFAGCSGLTRVELGDTVSVVGESAFEGCARLASLTLKAGITALGKNAFAGASIAELYFNATAMNNCALGDTPFSAAGATGGSALTIGAGVTRIPACLFESATLSSLSFESGSVCASIGASAFTKSTLPALTIPDGLALSIEQSAFKECTALTDVVIGANVSGVKQYAFAGCTALKTARVNADEIEGYTFEKCTALETLTLESNLTSLRGYAFSECTGLTKLNLNATALTDFASRDVFYKVGQNGNGVAIEVGANVTKIPAYFSSVTSNNAANRPKFISLAFAENSVCEEIGKHAFAYCTTLTSAEIPYGVTLVDEYAFGACTALKSVALDKNGDLEKIGEHAFDGCAALEGITVPDGVTAIEPYAFYGCALLKKATIGTNSNLQTLGAYAFYGCEALKSVAIPDNVKTVSDYAFYGCAGLETVTYGANSLLETVGASAFRECVLLKSADLPSGVTSIGEYAFYKCEKLVAVVFSNVLESIGAAAFDQCKYLNNVPAIPDSVHTIGSAAFRDAMFSNLTIGKGVKTLGSGAFYGCHFNTITFNATAMDDLTAESKPFYNLNSTTVIIGGNVTKIPAYLFYYDNPSQGNTKTITVRFENNTACKSIGKLAFKDLVGLTTNLYITDIAAWCATDFADASSNPFHYAPYTYSYYERNLYVNDVKVTHLTIPSTVTEIKPYAFYNFYLLEELTLPDSVNRIGAYAFWNCSKLTKLHIPTDTWNVYETAEDVENDTAAYGILATKLSEKPSCLTSTDVASDGFSAYYWRR